MLKNDYIIYMNNISDSMSSNINYTLKTVSELKELCRGHNIKGYSNKNKTDLIAILELSQNIYHAHNNGLIKKRLGKDHNASKKVRQLSLDGEVIQEFDAINDIARLTKFDGNYIINALKGKRETAYGFKWQYV